MIICFFLALLLVSFVFFGIIYRRMRIKLRLVRDETERWRTDYYQQESRCITLQHEKQHSELLARLVMQSPNAIMIMDNQGNIESINDGFTKMYGYSFREFTSALGQNYRQTSFSPDVQTRLDTVFETRSPYRYEAPNISRNGRQLWTQTALMPILNAEGEITHLATIDTDIDQRVNKSDRLVAEMELLNQKIDGISNDFKFFSSEFGLVFHRIEKLYVAMSKTDGILKFIEEIAAQTRLLGFNASIEAGRAGEFGNSFRVITTEIVDIAQRTSIWVKQIKEIFNSISDEQVSLSENKHKAEASIGVLNQQLLALKTELRSIENAISEFKSVS